jgi:hypothetical protein
MAHHLGNDVAQRTDLNSQVVCVFGLHPVGVEQLPILPLQLRDLLESEWVGEELF